MAITFRCTRCRARLHVPTRWGGTSVSCPKCSTRVVVPAGERSATRFERGDVERSLEQLQPVAGGTFAADSFAIPGPDESRVAAVDDDDGMTLSRRAVYAFLAATVMIAVASFALGALWMWSGFQR